jgi:hypothetical protein
MIAAWGGPGVLVEVRTVGCFKPVSVAIVLPVGLCGVPGGASA